MYGDTNSPYKHFGLEDGIVLKDEDPSGNNRVFVNVPGLLEPGAWADVIMLGSPRSRGDSAVPTVNSNVLVGFRHGDLTDPLVLGGYEPPVQEGGIRASIPDNERQKFRFIENEDWVMVLGATGTDFPYAAIMSRSTNSRVSLVLDLEAHTVKIEAPMGIHLSTKGVLKLDGTIVKINDRVISKNSQPL